MKFGHLLFPIFFFLVLITGAALLMRTVENQNLVGPAQPVYLDSSQSGMQVSAESVSMTRDKAQRAWVQFSEALVERDTLSVEEKENLERILELGEAHWGEENWEPAFYAFERVLNDLGSLIDEGLGAEKAGEMEVLFRDVSGGLTNEIALVEAAYLAAIETANNGYNALHQEDWIAAIQAFAKAIDSLKLVKAQAAEIVSNTLQEAYSAMEEGDVEKSANLFNEVLVVYPEKEEALKGLQLLQEEESADEISTAPQVPPDNSPTKGSDVDTLLPPWSDELSEIEEDDNPLVAQADRHYARRELKESLSLYLEVSSQIPNHPGLAEKIKRTRKTLQKEELIRLMDKASILMELKQWSGAVKTYRHVLNVDPVNKEARRGWEEAIIEMVSQQRIDQFKSLIRHHLNARQYPHAKDVLEELRNLLGDEENAEALLLPIEHELEQVQSPVQLVIESDNETWVAIPGKLAPERFERKEITLFPGKLEILGWKEGFEHRAESLSFSADDVPESVSIICDTPLDVSVDYENLNGPELVAAALQAMDMTERLPDVKSFSTWFLLGRENEGPLKTNDQIEDWRRALLAKLYAALNQQADQEFELTHLEAKAHYIKVPKNLTRKETIELGQYLMTLE